MTLKWICRYINFCYFDHKMSKPKTNVPRSYPGLLCAIPCYCISRCRLKNVVGQYFQILLSNVLSGKAWNLGKKLRKFELFQRIFHSVSDNDRHWPLHTSLWNVWWIINEPCADSSTSDCFVFTSIFLHLCLKISESHEVKVLKLCQLISGRTNVVINTMSNSKSI